jgi:hypothetical protein
MVRDDVTFRSTPYTYTHLTAAPLSYLPHYLAACGNFKYISSVLIMSNDSETRQPPQSVVNFSACWNNDSDNLIDVTWRSDAMTCVASVIGVLI